MREVGRVGSFTGRAGVVLLFAATSPAVAQRADVAALRAQLAETRALLEQQDLRLQEQATRLNALEERLRATAAVAAAPAPAISPIDGGRGVRVATSTASGDPATTGAMPVETVGTAPDDANRPPEIAVLGDQGSVITRAGQLTVEPQLEYARADRNRAVFRGIEPVESVLVGVFDINESRQDVVTSALAVRYGVTSGFEVGVRVPLVGRSDTSVLAPVAGSTNNDVARTRDGSVKGNGLGDVEFSLRYQLTAARPGSAFLIGNLQVVAPTGTNPFAVPRDSLGRALKAATGAGFWGVSPSLTAILPTDPAVLFGTLGYTRNLGRSVNTEIPPVRLTYVKPGDAISASAGIGLSLNQRTSLNLGYAHTWAFGTRTRSVLLDPARGSVQGDAATEQRARDLQIGRFLFGVTYRVTDRSSLNWTVEVGATDDATDLRTVLRLPIVLFAGR